MRKIKTILYASLASIFINRVMAGVDPYQIVHDPLFQSIQEENMGLQLEAMGTKGDQWLKMDQQYQQLLLEVKSLQNGFSDTADIQGLLTQVDGLIKQAKSYENYNDPSSQFSQNYKGFSADGESPQTPSEYDAIYKDNVNTTLQTIKNSNDAIEKDLNDPNNSPENISTTVTQARKDIANAEGTTQAVSGLAEINMQILKQLQQMHTQLAAMAESQNAAAGKEIQENATVVEAVRAKLDKDAISVKANYGDHSIHTPKL